MQRRYCQRSLLSLWICLWLSALGCEVRLPERGRGGEKNLPEEPASEPVPVPVSVTPEAPLPEKEEPDREASASPYLGKRDAKVTLIVFSDFQCRFCAKLANTLADLRARYGEDLRIVWKDMPLDSIHPNATSAAIAARAFLSQGVDKFFAMHDILFQNQMAFKSGSWNPEQFEQFALMVPGANIEQWRKDLLDPAHLTAIKNDRVLAGALGVTGTPTCFINGEKVRGAQDISKFIEVIERQKARADALLAAGISGEALYAELIGLGIEGKGPTLPPGTPESGIIYKVPVVTPTP